MPNNPPLCRHKLAVCSQCVVITDDARRISDRINAWLVFHGPWELRTKWAAFRLQDGTCDGNLYDTKLDAVRHVPNENYFAFFCFRNAVGGVNERDMQIWLNMQRYISANSDVVRLAQPEVASGGPDLIIPTGQYDRIMGRRRGNGPFWT